MKRLIYLLGLMLWLPFSAFSQQKDLDIPEVGRAMPDFILKKVTGYKTNHASLKDFKGKWLFLDFWFTGCISCIESFPKINEFQKQFGSEIQYMLVAAVDDGPGSWNKSEPTKRVFEKLRIKQGLVVPCAYDSVLTKKWKIGAMPYIIIIDPNGIIRSITTGVDLTASKIKELINGRNPNFALTAGKRLKFEGGVDNSFPKEKDSLVYFQSLFTRYTGETHEAKALDYQLISNEFTRKGYRMVGNPLYMIYNLAYFGEFNWDASSPLHGRIYPMPILQIKDSIAFDWNMQLNKGQYNYSLTLPTFSKPTKEYVMQVIQNDLKNCFGYEVRMETRKMPVYLFIAKANALEKLKNKGMPESFTGEATCPAGFSAVRKRMKDLIPFLTQHLKESHYIPFFDETAITDRIDITINADMSQIDQVKRELQRNGLDLMMGEREFKVMVIYDAKGEKFFTTDDFTYKSKVFTSQDSAKINTIIAKFVTPNLKPNWNGLNEALDINYSNQAEEIEWRTKTEYYKANLDVINFERSVKVYASKFIHMIHPTKLSEYAKFVFRYSLNEDLLEDADQWRRIYLNTGSIDEWFTAANVLYKLSLIKNQKIKGLEYMKTVVLKAEPSNKCYQETLAKMEKGEPTW
ncbi:redoxin family protein [Pedobacter heparinus]|uniref:redoxin family protein n=1 Tax=Pedobacter heparinus TaxID=984 RepID=UPI00292FD62A|nr:redoxin family protein [Pedobacter heparinus]